MQNANCKISEEIQNAETRGIPTINSGACLQICILQFTFCHLSSTESRHAKRQSYTRRGSNSGFHYGLRGPVRRSPPGGTWRRGHQGGITEWWAGYIPTLRSIQEH